MSPTRTGPAGGAAAPWRLRLARAVTVLPVTVVTALEAIGVLLVHRLWVGRGAGSLLAARPAEARRAAPRPRRPAR